MSTSFKLRSHNHQLLNVHLNSVKEIALKTHKSHGGNEDLNEAIELISMCHDFGKGTSYFQDYLTDKKNNNGYLKNHGLLSAIFAYWILPEYWKYPGYLVIKRHHGNLQNAGNELRFSAEEVMTFSEQIEDMKSYHRAELEFIYSKYLNKYQKRLEDFFNFAVDRQQLMNIYKGFLSKTFLLKDIMDIQYLYSLLLTADKSQLIIENTYLPPAPIESNFVNEYKNCLVKELLKDKPDFKDSIIFNIRNKISEELMSSLSEVDLSEDRLLSINVPTGSGKTILSYQAAFYLAYKIYSESKGTIYPQVIYSLPFMSIIDQNFDVLLNIFKKHNIDTGESELLKFHSLTPIKYEDYEGYDARFCFENWQSRVITTTFVQLFNTIFKFGDNSIVQRFHRLSNSIIILDEVQVLEEKYFRLIRTFLEFISQKYNIYFILVTATMPYLLKTKELIGGKQKYFNQLNRIIIENYTHEPVVIDQFIEDVKREIKQNYDKSILIVMNTVASARQVYEKLEKELRSTNIKFLSAEIYPALRLKKIKDIKETKERQIVVSTQLIEAGVDIDMDIIFRDFAPLDSINQTAGRANRNGLQNKGVLKLYKITNKAGKLYSEFIYPKSLLELTEDILNNYKIIHEKEIYSLSKKYYQGIDDRMQNLQQEELILTQHMIKKLKFKDLRNNFNLIEGKDELVKEDIIVNISLETSKILDFLKEGKKINKLELTNLFRKLNNYRISINKKKLKRLMELNAVNTINKYNLKYLDKSFYDCRIGLSYE